MAAWTEGAKVETCITGGGGDLIVCLFTCITDWFQMLTNLENGLAEDGNMIHLNEASLLGEWVLVNNPSQFCRCCAKWIFALVVYGEELWVIDICSFVDFHQRNLLLIFFTLDFFYSFPFHFITMILDTHLIVIVFSCVCSCIVFCISPLFQLWHFSPLQV